MITGLIHVRRPRHPEAIDQLADTLAGLVNGVAAGLVGDAVIVSTLAAPGLETVAEGSGAELVLAEPKTSPWITGARRARREWVLCLEEGDVLSEGWIRTLDRFVATAPPETVLARLARPHAPWSERFAKRAERMAGATGLRAGDLARCAMLKADEPFPARCRPRLLSARIERV